jgi:hypothetical protein
MPVVFRPVLRRHLHLLLQVWHTPQHLIRLMSFFSYTLPPANVLRQARLAPSISLCLPEVL